MLPFGGIAANPYCNAKRGAGAPRFNVGMGRENAGSQLAAAFGTSRCRFMTILLSAPR